MKNFLLKPLNSVIASDCKERSNLGFKMQIARHTSRTGSSDELWRASSRKALLAMTATALALFVILPISDAYALGRKPKTFNIQLKVDFGPAGKPAYDQPLEVERGSTAKDAVAQVFPIQSGKFCCSLREVGAIDGIKTEPEKSNWWICLLNGSKNFNPRTKELKPGDLVEWKYIHEVRGPSGEKQQS